MIYFLIFFFGWIMLSNYFRINYQKQKILRGLWFIGFILVGISSFYYPTNAGIEHDLKYILLPAGVGLITAEWIADKSYKIYLKLKTKYFMG